MKHSSLTEEQEQVEEVANLDLDAATSLSPEERKKQRMQRFGTQLDDGQKKKLRQDKFGTLLTDEKKKARESRFGKVQSLQQVVLAYVPTVKQPRWMYRRK